MNFIHPTTIRILPSCTGFIIKTDSGIDKDLLLECKHAIQALEKTTKMTFGASVDEQHETTQVTSLLLCVRSGGEENKKLLNLGMNDAVVLDICMSTGTFVCSVIVLFYC